MGHLKNYCVGDAVAHFRRRNGMRVLHPMGYDAFGLPAENNAIKTGQHPREATEDVDRRPSSASSAPGASRSTGRASSAPTSRATTAGPSGSSCSCSSAGWPTARRPRSTGAPRTPPCWPTSRSSTAAASAAAPRSSCASSSSGSSASPTTPTACSTTWTRSTGRSTWSRCSATGSAAPRAPRSRSPARSSGVDYSVFTTRPDTLFGATFFVMAPEHPDVLRLAAGTEHEQAVRDYVNGVLTENREERADTERTKTGVPLGRTRDQPGQRRADPDVRRRLRADGVRHRRDHGRPGPRRARLRLRDRVRPADPPRGRRRRASCPTRATARW